MEYFTAHKTRLKLNFIHFRADLWTRTTPTSKYNDDNTNTATSDDKEDNANHEAPGDPDNSGWSEQATPAAGRDQAAKWTSLATRRHWYEKIDKC